MAIYADSLPYLVTKPKRVALPRLSKDNKMGFDNLVFPFTKSVKDTIHVINNKQNLFNDGRYYYYYYNLLYRGTIGGRRYNIKSIDERKKVYELVTKLTPLHAHPPSLLNATQNRNCYFEMSKYFEIYLYLAQKFTPLRKMNLFWSFFRSIWMSEQTSTYSKKWVVIDADLFSKYGTSLKEKVDNPLFMLYYTLYKNFNLISDLDIDFLIFCKGMVLRVNPSKCDEKSYILFKRELTKIYNKVTIAEELNEKIIDKEEQSEEIKNTLKQQYNFTGKTEDDSEITSLNTTDHRKLTSNQKQNKEIEELLDKKIDEKINKAVSNAEKILPEESITSDAVKTFVATQSEIDIDEDKEIVDRMYKVMQQQKVPTRPVNTVRDKILRERQESLKLNDITFKDLTSMKAKSHLVTTKNVASSIKNINENVKQVKFANLNKDYLEKNYQSDILKVFTSLNNKSSKFYVKDVSVQDSSNELNYKDTYRISLEDEVGQRHSIIVDIPKFLDNKFLYLGGNKKIIDRQNFLLPVVKTAPDTVQIVTNYNKMFIRRIGTKSISSVERLMKLITSNDKCHDYFTIGNNSAVNRSFLTTIEYDEFGKVMSKFITKNCEIFFNQQEAINYASSHIIEIPDNNIFIGMKDNKPIFINPDTQVTSDNQSICDLIVTELPEELRKEFLKTKSTKKLIYNTVTIMAQTIPFIVLLIYWEGITSVFKKMNLKYRFSERYPSELQPNENVIRFADCFVVYNGDLSTDLLLNGLKALNTENYNFTDYDTKEPYIDFFKKVYGKVAITNAIYNAYDFTIDPITLEILQDTNLPTDLVELCIYASNLLADETYTIENSQRIARVRSIEVIPAMLYNEISRAFIAYKNSGGKIKLSIPKDSVIKALLGLQTVEDYSVLNPVVELEKDRAITSKGYRGINVDRAYSEEKRSYDDSMIGIISMNTSPDGNCGINRFLTLEPNITSTRGYVDIKDDKREELKDVNLFSAAELLYPLGNTRDDSIRTSMAAKQSKHVIPVLNSIPALISNGVDEVIKYNLSSDFVIMAEEDGTVIDYDNKSGIMMLKYKSGKTKAIDLTPHIVKNGAGGFFLSNQLQTKLSVGSKFKKDDTLAWHKDFFTDDGINGVRMNVGVLEKVAIVSSYSTYNDNTTITEKLAKDCTTNMTFCKQAVIGKNSNVYNMKKIGDHVSIGESLLDFDVSFEDSDLNKLLSHLSETNKGVLEENSMTSIKSKHAGKIIDIKMYSSVGLEELSPSLQEILRNYYRRINERKKFVSKYDTENGSIVKCGLLLNEATGKVEPNMYGVIKGQKVQDSVLIEFYIEHGDILGVGDKIAYFTALKGIVGEVIPEGYEPYSEFRPEEEVSSVFCPSSILKRQVPSIILTVLGNKVIVELKRKLEEIYKS